MRYFSQGAFTGALLGLVFLFSPSFGRALEAESVPADGDAKPALLNPPSAQVDEAKDDALATDPRALPGPNSGVTEPADKKGRAVAEDALNTGPAESAPPAKTSAKRRR